MFRRLLIAIVSFVLFAVAAQAETAEEAYARGVAFGNAKNFEAALPLIRQAAEAGLAKAQFTLGSMYSNGQGVPPSKSEARVWFERAAAQSHPVALYNLGLFYDRGVGVAKDMRQAMDYYRRGAEAGDGQAAYNAGQILMLGDGVPASVTEGVRFIERSAALGTSRAHASLGYIYQTGFGVPKDAVRALEHYARAEAGGIAVAGERGLQLASTVLEEGLALERARYGYEALKFLDLSCRFGQFTACYNAGRMRYKGEIVVRDVTTAVANFRAACKWDNAPGCRALADAVMTGASSSPEDLRQAVAMMTSLCEANSGPACHNLAVIKLQPRYRINDQPGAMKLLAQNCLNRGFQPSCQPYFDMYNASLPKSSGSGSSGGMSSFEQGIVDVLGIIAGTMSAIGSAGQSSQGSYSGYSSYAPSSSTGGSAGGYSPQDRADYNQFIDSVSAYGQHVKCRPGNPYC